MSNHDPYEVGYEEGESSVLADLRFAMTEIANWPEDADMSPSAIASRWRDSLDAAWAEAEAALPKGHRINTLTRNIDGWLVWSEGPHSYGDEMRHGIGPTPAAALRALAMKLRKNPNE